MEVTRWSDDRLDDLNGRVKSLEVKMDAGFARLDGRIDKMNHTMLQGMVALISLIAVLLTAFLTIVVTRL